MRLRISVTTSTVSFLLMLESFFVNFSASDYATLSVS